MTCRTFFDIKKVAYNTADYTEDNYMLPIGITFQQVLTSKDGFSLETKGETSEFTVLNGVRYLDSERVPLRITGVLKFSKILDSSLLVNHSDLIDAGLGVHVDAVTSAVVVTGGKGSVADPFLTTVTTGISVGSIVKIPDFGYRLVKTIAASTSFTVDTPLAVAISGSTVFSKPMYTDITNPVGNCAKTFNFVVELDSGEAIQLMGCGVQCEFSIVYEKQLSISFTITSPEATELAAVPTGFASPTLETKGTPVMCSFASGHVVTAGVFESYIPINFDLGFSVALEPMKAIGGRNNIVGYTNRASIKSKITFARLAKCLVWVNAPRTVRQYYFVQSNFAIIIENGLLTLTDRSVANGSHESIVCEMDNNVVVDKKVYLVLP